MDVNNLYNFYKMFLSIFIIEHTCLYYLQTEISINLIGSLGSLFCPSEFKGKHVQGEEGEGGCLQVLHMYTALLFTNSVPEYTWELSSTGYLSLLYKK